MEQSWRAGLCQNACHQTFPMRFGTPRKSVKSPKGVIHLSSFLSLSALFNQCPAALTHTQQMQHANESSFDVPGAFVEYCNFKRTYCIHYEMENFSIHFYNLPDVQTR